MVNSSAVEISELSVSRGGVDILHSISCTLPTGSITGLLGPSGCGKTTLMRTIVGAQRITSGQISVLGRPAGSPDLRHRIGYTSQAVSIYPDITVADNVSYFAGLLGASPADVDRAIAQVELSDYAHRPVAALSGGQASRASLACALVGTPRLLVLDEPTVGLDPLTRANLWATFRTLTDNGTTLLVSSHVMDEATRCDSVLFLRDGHLLAHEPIDTLQARTNTTTAEDAFLALITKEA